MTLGCATVCPIPRSSSIRQRLSGVPASGLKSHQAQTNTIQTTHSSASVTAKDEYSDTSDSSSDSWSDSGSDNESSKPLASSPATTVESGDELETNISEQNCNTGKEQCSPSLVYRIKQSHISSRQESNVLGTDRPNNILPERPTTANLETPPERESSGSSQLKSSAQVPNYNQSAATETIPTNPRRTSSEKSANTSSQGIPATLTRQSDRQQNFVESLVDTATQMVEVIWPLSTVACDKDYLGGKNLIGMRTFIQEVLKRSKTSFYTLQVALFYLVLIKSELPAVDRSRPQADLTHAQRAMQCGRRMFLAALILASKYLQDRNYSARAWSKISGLKVQEINSNEMAFLHAVNWKLHIPEAKFHRWSGIVWKYSTSQSSTTCLQNWSSPRWDWRAVVAHLTPELSEAGLDQFTHQSSSQLQAHLAISSGNSVFWRSQQSGASYSPASDSVSTPANISPATTMASLSSASTWSPQTLRHSNLLPTPAQTPRSSLPSAWAHGQAMQQVCLQVQESTFNSYATEPYPAQPVRHASQAILPPSRRPLARMISSTSLISSPESMVSDLTQSSMSARSSRSSSISSSAPSIQVLGENVRPQGSIHMSHRSAMGILNGPLCSMSQYSDSCEKSIDYRKAASEDAHEGALALLRLQGYSQSMRSGSYTPSVSRTLSSALAEVGHKRARPLSMSGDEIVNGQVRQTLLQHTNCAEVVAPFMLGSQASSAVTAVRPMLRRDLLRDSTGLDSRAPKRLRSYCQPQQYLA